MTGRQLLELAEARRLIRERARLIREAKDLSETEIAGALHVSPAAVSRWERNLRRPTARLALAYARLLASLDE